jgi:hypothetical protein
MSTAISPGICHSTDCSICINYPIIKSVIVSVLTELLSKKFKHIAKDSTCRGGSAQWILSCGTRMWAHKNGVLVTLYSLHYNNNLK